VLIDIAANEKFLKALADLRRCQKRFPQSFFAQNQKQSSKCIPHVLLRRSALRKSPFNLRKSARKTPAEADYADTGAA
jgi:hypothetical protein